MFLRTIQDYHFLADKTTGVTFRWGKSFDDNPPFAPVPELADISISNCCKKYCDFCYRESTSDGAIMSVKDYCHVLDSMCHPQYGNVFQVALGGGEPLEHPEFMAIIDETLKRDIVPNFTTNGSLLTDGLLATLKDKVGAIAISVNDIRNLVHFREVLQNGVNVRINVHYILSQQSVDQAVRIMEGAYNHLLVGVNAIVFLTYKPAGRGKENNVLRQSESLRAFLKKIQKPQTICKIGFDACFVPMLLRNTMGMSDYVDFCEGGFFSVYINEKKEVSPCSFSKGRESYSLDEFDFYDIWLNQFQSYRDSTVNLCKNECDVKNICRGACPYYPSITTCYQQ